MAGLEDGSGSARPGDTVPIRFAKWGGTPHWSADVVWLGEDEHGWWGGWPEGTHWTRPGAEFTSFGLQVGLFSRDRGFAATFYEHVSDYEFRVYVDVTTVPTWRSGTLTAVDLDLDVIQRFDGTVFVDDEDEFAEHRVSLGYPDHLVGGAEEECARLVDELRSGATRFDEALAARWRAELRRLLRA